MNKFYSGALAVIALTTTLALMPGCTGKSAQPETTTETAKSEAGENVDNSLMAEGAGGEQAEDGWDKAVRLAQSDEPPVKLDQGGEMEVWTKEVPEVAIGVPYYPKAKVINPPKYQMAGKTLGGTMMQAALKIDEPLETVAAFYRSHFGKGKLTQETKSKDSIVFTQTSPLKQVQVSLSTDPVLTDHTNIIIIRIDLDAAPGSEKTQVEEDTGQAAPEPENPEIPE